MPSPCHLPGIRGTGPYNRRRCFQPPRPPRAPSSRVRHWPSPDQIVLVVLAEVTVIGALRHQPYQRGLAVMSVFRCGRCSTRRSEGGRTSAPVSRKPAFRRTRWRRENSVRRRPGDSQYLGEPLDWILQAVALRKLIKYLWVSWRGGQGTDSSARTRTAAGPRCVSVSPWVWAGGPKTKGRIGGECCESGACGGVRLHNLDVERKQKPQLSELRS